MKTDLDVISPQIPEEILQRVEARGINRRDFIKFCTATTAALALPISMLAQGRPGDRGQAPAGDLGGIPELLRRFGSLPARQPADRRRDHP